MGDNLRILFSWFPILRKLFEAKTAKEFDEFLDGLFKECVERMEAEAHHLNGDCEEKLSAFLAAALSMPGLSVMRESYSNGRVDLTIKTESIKFPEKRLAEAKIYSGPSYHEQAIEQLVTRYSTGRQSRGYVLEFVKKAGISQIVKKLRTQADADRPVVQQGATKDHQMKWAYESDHLHSSGEVLKVLHINVNLYRG